MANKIQFKRGLKSNLPAKADVGMPLWCTDTKELFIGTGDGVSKITGGTQSQSQTDVTNQTIPVITDPLSVLEDDDNYLEYKEYYENKNIIFLKENTVYNLSLKTEMTFIPPEIQEDSDTFHQILIQLKVESEDYSVDFGTSYFFNGNIPEISVGKQYNIIYEYDKTIGWVCGSVEKGVSNA